MVPPLQTILSPYFKKRIPEIQRFIEDPFYTQEMVFRNIMGSAKKTNWGKEHGLESVKYPSDLSKTVRVQDYDSLKPYISRMMNGEENVLWPAKIRWYAKSSGTTSDKSKFIPVSDQALKKCHYKASRDLLAVYLHNHPESKIFNGKGIIMGGSHQINKLDHKSSYGDLSAVLMKNLPILAKIFHTPGLEVTLMDDWDKKIRLIAELVKDKNITNISGVPTWTMVLIKKLFEMTGKDNLSDIWPNLELYIHGGVSFTPYRSEFKKLIPSAKMNYMETYNASEGFFAFQNDPVSDDLLLMLDYGIFYEFIPNEELEKDEPKTLLLQEVELGKSYAIVVTTNAGLYRYLIGDTITFTSVRPFKIKISGRTKHFINVFGEEVIIDNSDNAIAMTCDQLHVSAREYTVAPVFLTDKQKGKHEWAIEFIHPPEDLEKFIELLDQNLQSLNSDYEAKRFKGLALELPIVHQVRPGTFYRWLKYKGKLGGQHKVPRLSNERKILNEILQFDN